MYLISLRHLVTWTAIRNLFATTRGCEVRTHAYQMATLREFGFLVD
ncbi:hypothetical protein PAA8504_03362 [Palleronia abyssalis]|uniref:Uncharacterized protein n=1 Tax=Palleronia abyssalis TaxID=1501240 RepID=A0A2R8BZA9_9RHOB|nr:hypothetical protein PAA8504_03362 [Palleronia abyssalis]